MSEHFPLILFLFESTVCVICCFLSVLLASAYLHSNHELCISWGFSYTAVTLVFILVIINQWKFRIILIYLHLNIILRQMVDIRHQLKLGHLRHDVYVPSNVCRLLDQERHHTIPVE